MKQFICVVLLCLSCAFTALAQELPIIDAHTHTDFSGGPERSSGIPKTEAEYFKEWREAGIVGAVAHISPTGANFHDLKNRNVVYCAGVGLTMDIPSKS